MLDLKKGQVIQVTTILGIAFALLGGFEGILRALAPHKVASAYAFHESYLVTLKPGVNKTFKRAKVNGGQRIQWKSNSNGFRGEELNTHPSTRVIVYGDSNVQARFSHLKDTYPYRLRELLQGRIRSDVEVLNAGLVGFGPDQSFLRFQEEAEFYNPDLVIFHLFADNDFGDLLRNRLFKLNRVKQLVPSNVPATVDPRLQFISSLLTVREATGIARSVLQSLSPERTSLEAGLALSDAEYDSFRFTQSRTYSHFADHYDFDIALTPQQPSSQVKIRILGEVLRAASLFAASKDIGFVVLIQPSARDLTTILSPNHTDFAAYPGYRPENLSTFIADLCGQHHIPYINLYDFFAENDPNRLFLKEDSHWNNAGQALAARVTADYLLSGFAVQGSKFLLSEPGTLNLKH